MLACSLVRATRTIRNITEVAAAETQTTRAPTASGEPKLASKRNPPTASSTALATTPRVRLTSAFEATIRHAGIGMERRRRSVPVSRSSSRLVTPKLTVNIRNRPVCPATSAAPESSCSSDASPSARVYAGPLEEACSASLPS